MTDVLTLVEQRWATQRTAFEAAITRRAPGDEHWYDRAACQGADSDLFDLSIAGDHDKRTALAYCQRCPVRAECLDDAIAHGDRLMIRGGQKFDTHGNVSTDVTCGKCGKTFPTSKTQPAKFCGQGCRTAALSEAGNYAQAAAKGRAAQDAMTATAACRYAPCGAQFTRPLRSHRAYCSERCRTAEYRRRHHPPRPPVTKTCKRDECTVTFTARANGPHFCSDECRQVGKRATRAQNTRDSRARRKGATAPEVLPAKPCKRPDCTTVRRAASRVAYCSNRCRREHTEGRAA